MLGKPDAPQKEQPKENKFGVYFGENISPEKQQEMLKEVKSNPERFKTVEYEGVSLLRVSAENLPNGRKEHYFIMAKPRNSGEEQIAGYRSVEFYPEEKRIVLEVIEVFPGDQSKEISAGNFRGQKIGERSILALVKFLNEQGMNGWEVVTTAINRGFAEKVFQKVFNATEEAGGWDMFRGKVQSLQKTEEALGMKKEKGG
jgi:hypothetical protein